jgi:hypothetical protein
MSHISNCSSHQLLTKIYLVWFHALGSNTIWEAILKRMKSIASPRLLLQSLSIHFFLAFTRLNYVSMAFVGPTTSTPITMSKWHLKVQHPLHWRNSNRTKTVLVYKDTIWAFVQWIGGMFYSNKFLHGRNNLWLWQTLKGSTSISASTSKSKHMTTLSRGKIRPLLLCLALYVRFV